MKLKDDVLEIKKEVDEVKNKSFAMELISDARKANKRMFIIIIILIVVLCMWFITIGYLVYILNDISSVETTTQEVSDVDTIENSNVANGDIYGEN